MAGGLLSIATALVALAAASSASSATRISTTPIAFASDRSGNLDIYVTDRTGTKTTQLTTSPASDVSPTWSPDGKQIAFASNRNGFWQIWTMSATGANQHSVTRKSHGADTSPVWSPDGKLIAFATSRSGNWEIYVMNPDGSGQRNVTNDAAASDLQATWSPNSKTIAFARVLTGRSDLYTADVTSSRPKIKLLFKGGTLPVFDPAYSPDGSKIAADRRSKTNYALWVMNADGTSPHAITSSAAEDAQPTWSPDGSEIAFTSLRDGDYEIYVVDPSGKQPRNITNEHTAVDMEPSWALAGTAPSKRELAAAASRAGLGCTAPGPGSTATHIYGTGYHDVLCGTPASEWISALGSYDTLWGNDGSDTLEGGSGNDTFYARDGYKDWLYGGTKAYGDSGSGDAARIDHGLDLVYGIENPNL